jgi:hypothetical protein
MSDQEQRRKALIQEAKNLLENWSTASIETTRSLVQQNGPIVEMVNPSGIVSETLVSTHEAVIGIGA